MLILSTGSNIGDRVNYLNQAKFLLSKSFNFVEESSIYESPAVDYLNQPDFLNQVLSFQLPELTPEQTLNEVLNIELLLGRERLIDKGPRTIDIDILFWDNLKIESKNLMIPHPRLFERSFIVEPLQELSYFSQLQKSFSFSEVFDNSCWVLTNH